jgi:hypothetical protein
LRSRNEKAPPCKAALFVVLHAPAVLRMREWGPVGIWQRYEEAT